MTLNKTITRPLFFRTQSRYNMYMDSTVSKSKPQETKGSKKAGEKVGQSQGKKLPKKAKVTGSIPNDIQLLVENLIALDDKSIAQKNLELFSEKSKSFGKSLIEAIYEKNSKPNKSFKLEKLSLDSISQLSSRINSPYYILWMATNQNLPYEIRKAYLQRFQHLEYSESYFDFLNERLKISDNSQRNPARYFEIVSTGIFSEDGWNKHTFTFLNLILENNISLEQKILLSNQLNESYSVFAALENKDKIKILQKIWSRDIQFFWIYLLNISNLSLNFNYIDEIVTDKRVESLVEFCNLKKNRIFDHHEKIIQKLVAPLFKSYVGSVMRFSQILDLYPYLEILTDLCGFEIVKSSLNRCYGEEDEISKLLTDSKGSEMESQFGELTKKYEAIYSESIIYQERLRAYEERLQEMERTLTFTEEQLRESLIEKAASQNSLMEQKVISTLKEVVQIFDEVLNVEEYKSAQIFLERLGIEQVGLRGEEMVWDPDLCQTMTGETIGIGLVVGSGYIWHKHGKKMVLKRVILKPR